MNMTLKEVIDANREGKASHGRPVHGMLTPKGGYLFGGKEHPNQCLGEINRKTVKHIKRFNPEIIIK